MQIKVHPVLPPVKDMHLFLVGLILVGLFVSEIDFLCNPDWSWISPSLLSASWMLEVYRPHHQVYMFLVSLDLFCFVTYRHLVCLCCMSAHVGADSCEHQQRIPWSWSLQVVVSHPMWMLEIKFRSFARTGSSLNLWDVAPAPCLVFSLFWFGF